MSSLRVVDRQILFSLSRLPALRQAPKRNFSWLRPSRPVPSRQIHTPCRPKLGYSGASLRKPVQIGKPKVRCNSSNTSPNPTPHLGSPEPKLSVSQRLKQLSREYGWTAVGVYLALSALDFPFCFLAVRTLGTDRIASWEHAVVEWCKSVVAVAFPSLIKDTGSGTEEAVPIVDASKREGSDMYDIEMAEKSNAGKNATIWTQLALAYAIHKSFIFIRVPLTAAILPKVVKTLRGWGWKIGKKQPATLP